MQRARNSCWDGLFTGDGTVRTLFIRVEREEGARQGAKDANLRAKQEIGACE